MSEGVGSSAGLPFGTVASLEGATLSTDGSEDGGKAGSEIRCLNDWYEVVIAVVAVGPFAIGVRYSVRVECTKADGVSMVKDFVV